MHILNLAMSRRSDIKSIMIIGAGPIVIGQACEFDYSGTQACKALKEEGYRVILVNSNPATIMTDPDFADVTYIEPLTVEVLAKIIEKERPCALLPTLGGQTGLNLSVSLAKEGILEQYGVELIGAKLEAIEKGEDRELFRQAMKKIGLDVPLSGIAHSRDEAHEIAEKIGEYPLIIRPSFTLGGAGGGIAYNKEEFDQIVINGLSASPVGEVLVEECLIGWKEYEMEVMRDHKDQCVVICSIENIDPMGVHTGDSITVAPAMTLSDKEFQLMRDASFAVIREVGVETGGSNVQFAVDPKSGRLIVIEMNPRVSRSSALASKATGFPIAKIAAKLAVGYSLDELKNDITKETVACFEPSIDYVVTKIPRFTFEKFVGADRTLTSSMKSVGETMAIGRTFKESFQKALRSLEIGSFGFGGGGKYGGDEVTSRADIMAGLARPSAERMFYIRYALRAGFSIEEIFNITFVDPWFLYQFKQLVDMEKELAKGHLEKELLKKAKEAGFTDKQISLISGKSMAEIGKLREEFGIKTIYRLVDTCAGEFAASTPYYYSTYGDENEIMPSEKEKILIIGGGPNRIGQGIEFDYCCVHASYALRDAGYETVMINSNPETVSTDYDTSDKLYFEPLTLEDVLEVYRQEGCSGAIVQLGGQTPLNLAGDLERHGVKILGTTPANIDLAEDRKLFKEVLHRLELKQPENKIAMTPEEASELALEIGFPILLRPSFVLGGRGMFIVHTMEDLQRVVYEAFGVAPGKPVLLDKFLEDAIEVDVDCLCDGEDVVIAGILEHIEYAGVHSGDAAMVMPPHTMTEVMIEEIRVASYALAKALNVIGLMNVQYAFKDGELYILEVNPRASRTVPFVAKAIGKPIAKYAARIMVGEKLKNIGFTEEVALNFWAVKESVFPFARFPGAPIMLSPEMRSTGEVMGIDPSLWLAYGKAQMAAKTPLPLEGTIFLSVKDVDKPRILDLAHEFKRLGFNFVCTPGTMKFLQDNDIPVKNVFHIYDGARPNVIDFIKNGEIQMIINTPFGLVPQMDENKILSEALSHGVCVKTTISGARAALNGIKALKENALEVNPLQYYKLQLI